MTFMRRFSELPSREVLAEIEAVNIVDLEPPANTRGLASGLCAFVGEFPDCTYAVTVSEVGVVTSNYRPTRVTSGAELVQKLGGCDPTIGEFGGSGGNGFVMLRNKVLPGGFVVVPINLAGSNGVRMWRTLPTNRSMTNPSPILPISSATVRAGREFTASSGRRVRTAAAASFTNGSAILTGVDAAMSVATGTSMNVVVGGDITASIAVGMALVLGVLGGSAANQGTYRVASASYSSPSTTIVVERQDAESFTSVLATAQPWRLHAASDADTGGANTFAACEGFRVPARPLTNNSGSTSASGTILQGLVMSPAEAESTSSATTWAPLSGITLAIMPTVGDQTGGLAFVPARHAINAVSATELDTEYVAAMAALLGDAEPQKSVNIGPVCARTSATIRLAQRQHRITASQYGYGRVVVMAPPLTVITRDAVTASTTPGVGTYRDEGVFYAWFGFLTYIPELVGYSVKGADGQLYTNGFVDTPADAWLASIMCNVAPEEDPAQETRAVKDILAAVIGYQRSAPILNIDDYKILKAAGIVTPNWNTDLASAVFQSGVTSDIRSGHTNISRIRMDFFINDSLAVKLKPFVKVLNKPVNKEGALDVVTGFLDGLLSPDNPDAARIKGYNIDLTLNTDETDADGFFYIGWNVRVFQGFKALVGVSRIGESVVINPST